ncbi:MAG: biotin/lipoyl-binding protein [Prevotella sp.]|nr:biotin/lipoyl-binding protein [Prevotella sp.]
MSKYEYTVNGVDYNVEIESIENNIAVVTVNGKTFEIEMKEAFKAPRHIEKPQAPAAPKAAPAPAPKAAPAAAPVAAPAPAPASANGTKVTAPLPGTITEVKVAVGDVVKTGDTVVILEAMKMQNNIEAECDGTITAISVKQGDTVLEGSTLVVIG